MRLVFPRLGEDLWTSSALLCSKSPFFADLFSSGFVEGQKQTIALPEMSSDEPPPLFEDSDDASEDEAEGKSSAPAQGGPSRCEEEFHTVKVSDTSRRTYACLLVWLGTGHISFAPLLSSFRDTYPSRKAAKPSRSLKIREMSAFDTPDSQLPAPASPKSIYRLAHLLSLAELSALALANFRSQLTPTNVAHELFSDVSGAYPDMQKAALDYAAGHWSEVKESEGWKEAEKKAEEGALEHPVGMLMALTRLLK